MNTIFRLPTVGFILMSMIAFQLGTSHTLFAQATLIAYYPFDGNAGDSSGNGHHGTLFGGTYAPDRHGNPNSTVALDGLNDYIEFITSPLYQPSLPITISAWAYLEDYDPNVLFGNCYEEDGYHGVWLNLAGGRLSAAFGDGGLIGPSWRRSKAGSTTLPLSTWVHVAIVIRGATDMDLYVNGRNDCGTYSGSGGPLGYGNFPGAAGVKDGINGAGILEHYHGRIDELRFHAGELAEAEIRQLASFDWISQVTSCPDDSIVLNGGLAATYSWSPSAGLSCNSCAAPLATPATSTQYILTTTNGAGCINQDTVWVEVDSLCITDCKQMVITARYTYSAQGQTVQFIDSVSGGTIDEIKWDFGDGNTLSTHPGATPSHVYTNPGTYVVCMIAVDTVNQTLVCQGTFCDSVVVERADTTCEDLNLTGSFTHLVQAFDVQFTGSTAGGSIDEVRWDFGDGTVITTFPGNQPRHRYVNPGVYQVCMTAIDSVNSNLTCTTVACQPVTITDAMSIDAAQLTKAGIHYGPNPGQSHLVIRSTFAPIAQVAVWDMTGKSVLKPQHVWTHQLRLDAEAWTQGIYFVSFISGGQRYSLKWIKN